MHRHRIPPSAHRIALQAIIGEPGMSGMLLVLLATGTGLLLDFQVFNLHPVFSVGLPLASIPVSLFWAILRTLRMTNKPTSEDYMRNLALATVAGQSGCMTVVVIFMALFAGMFLDSKLNTHPLFTIGLVLVSVPVSLYLMIRLALSSVAAIKFSSPDKAASPGEEAGSGPAAGSLQKEKRS
jgi:L-asparagine transporter-like permease